MGLETYSGLWFHTKIHSCRIPYCRKRNAECSRSQELGREVGGIELAKFRGNSAAIGAGAGGSLLGSHARYQRYDGISDIVGGAQELACNRARIIIDGVGLPALRYGLPTNGPPIDNIAQCFAGREAGNRIAVVDQKNVGLIEVGRGVVCTGSERVIPSEK